MTKNMNYKTWNPSTIEGQKAKLAYMELEAKQKAMRTPGLTDAQKAAYAQELFNDMKAKYMPEGITAQPSALERALNSVPTQPATSTQPRDNLGRYESPNGDPDNPDSDSFVSIFDEPRNSQ